MGDRKNKRSDDAREQFTTDDHEESPFSEDQSVRLDVDHRRNLKVALACPGVGLVQRGFERMFSEIYQLSKSDLDITLYKGGGVSNQREIVLRFANRNGWIAKYLPVHRLARRTPIHLECFTFCVSLLYAIRKQNYDVVHVIDPPLARLLYHFRNKLNLKFRILYTEGCAMPPANYPPADHLQQVSQATFEDAVQFGWPEDYMTYLPVGFYPERFEVAASRSALRNRYNIDEKTFVILSIAAVNRKHKRVDYLISEVAKLDGDVLLWLDGSMDQGDPELIEFAREKLGKRCRITHVPTAKVGELLKIVDLFVHTSVHESFGLSIVEAAAAGLPLLIHNSAHFQWLLPNSACWVDMGVENELAGRVENIMRNRDELALLRAADEVRARYSWHRLKVDYLKLYRRVAELPLERLEK